MSAYLLCCALVQLALLGDVTVTAVPLAASASALSSLLPTPSSAADPAKRENAELARPASLESNASAADSRRGHERNLMVVLPVMQGNADLTNSNLQSLYTKPPVTAIIGEDSKDLRQEDARTTHPRQEDLRADHHFRPEAERRPAQHKVMEKRIDNEPPKRETGDRHPYTDFLFSKPAAKTSKSPLDYGYPESFKFVQELNELPKNHKPEWVVPDLQPEPADKVHVTSATEGTATKGDPFQMFESVKPLEINKLLSFRPAAASAPVTDSIVEESSTKPRTTTVAPSPSSPRTKRPPHSKRPTKKPQKVKLSPQKLTEADISSLTSTTTTTSTTAAAPTRATTTVVATDLDSDYTAARFTPLFAETTKAFLPTPYVSNDHVATHIREIAPRTSTWTPPAVPPPPPPPFSPEPVVIPNFRWANTSANVSTTELAPAKAVAEVKPSDLVSLTKILGEHFDPKVEPPLKQVTTKSPFPEDMLTNDMKNMLIALGILKSEGEPSMLTTERTTTTENYLFNVFGKLDEPAPPTIDPHAYVSFKKMPVHFERPRDRLPVSDDMKDLLASFGLLPKRSGGGFGNSILTRISRQHDLAKLEAKNSTDSTETNATAETPAAAAAAAAFSANATSEADMLPEEVKHTLENLGLLQPLAYHYQPHRNGHVFQPSVHLEQLGDRQKVQKINEAIETIRKLSKNKDAENLSIEEIEKRLENVTALLRDDHATANVSLGNDLMTKIVEYAKKPPNATESSAGSSDVKIERGQISNVEAISVEPHDDRERIPSAELSLPDLHNITIIEPESTPDESSEEPDDGVKTDATRPADGEPMSPLKPHDVDKIVEAVQKIPAADENSLRLPEVHYNSDESVVSAVQVNSSGDANRSTELNLVMNPPNPLSPEELQQLLEFNKNDIKRQQPAADNATSTAAPSTVQESSSSSPTSTEEASSEPTRVESNNAPISDLAASFGGEQTASGEPTAGGMATQRPNGLYFYLDWNTFLNVGESDKNPVRIRFSPRAGNARNFLNITVP